MPLVHSELIVMFKDPVWDVLSQILTLPSGCGSWNEDLSDQTTFSRCVIVTFWWACVKCSLYVLFFTWQEYHPLCSSAAGDRFLFFSFSKRVVFWVLTFCITSVFLFKLTSTLNIIQKSWCFPLNMISSEDYSL